MFRSSALIALLTFSGAVLPPAASIARAQVQEVQSDWSGGPGAPGPVPQWNRTFDETSGVAWRPIPGQLALESRPVTQPLQHIVEPDADHPAAIAAGDLDGDGHDDLVVADPIIAPLTTIGAIYWWRLTPGGTWEQLVVDEDFYGARYVDTFDVDLDGDVDVLAAAYYGVVEPPPPPPSARNGRYAWFENLAGDGSAWKQHLVGELFWGANWIDAGDLDGDGDIDLVGASQLTDGIHEQEADLAWFENVDGDGDVWTQHDLDLHFDNASEAHVTDLDGDGDLDVVASQSPPFGASNFHWWENVQGDGTTWTKRQIPFSFQGVGYLDVGDIDGDGDLDLLGGGRLTSAIAWWENLDGTGTSWQAWQVGPLVRGLVVRLGDLDGDGDLDGLAASDQLPESGGLWWYENLTGTGTSWQLRTLDFMASAGPWVDIGDANRDGKPDAVVSMEDAYNNRSEQLSWWDLTTFSPFGELTSSVLDAGKPQWGAISWDATVGTASALTVEVRASDDATDLGPFIEVPASGTDLSLLIGPNPRFFQYRLALESFDPSESPIVRELRVVTVPLAPIFSDGFESGDTSAWSVAVP